MLQRRVPADRSSTVGVCTQVVAPVGPYKGGTTARISKIEDGKTTTVATGLASTVDQMGDVIGIADVAFLGGDLFALVSGGGCSHGNPTLPNGVVRVNTKNGQWRYIDDLSLFVQEHPPAYNTYNDYEPDGVAYSMVAEKGELFVVEPNHAADPAGSAGWCDRPGVRLLLLFCGRNTHIARLP